MRYTEWKWAKYNLFAKMYLEEVTSLFVPDVKFISRQNSYPGHYVILIMSLFVHFWLIAYLHALLTKLIVECFSVMYYCNRINFANSWIKKH